MSAQWGKLASEILLQNWDASLEDFKRLKEVIDGDVSFMVNTIIFKLQKLESFCKNFNFLFGNFLFFNFL